MSGDEAEHQGRGMMLLSAVLETYCAEVNESEMCIFMDNNRRLHA